MKAIAAATKKATRQLRARRVNPCSRASRTPSRALDPAHLTDPRGVGRKQLPTTVNGLLVHIAEHTQRHVGQAICAAKLARVA